MWRSKKGIELFSFKHSILALGQGFDLVLLYKNLLSNSPARPKIISKPIFRQPTKPVLACLKSLNSYRKWVHPATDVYPATRRTLFGSRTVVQSVRRRIRSNAPFTASLLPAIPPTNILKWQPHLTIISGSSWLRSETFEYSWAKMLKTQTYEFIFAISGFTLIVKQMATRAASLTFSNRKPSSFDVNNFALLIML